MDITNANFVEALQLVRESIDEAQFIALDLEFTGLCTSASHRIHPLDSGETRYQKVKGSTETFTMLQAGLCTVFWHAELNKYVAKPFNFYLYPRGRNSSFICEAASLSFLASCDFDFNKTIKEGVSFVRRHAANKLRDQAKSQNNDDDIPLGGHEKFVEDTCAQITEWLQTSKESTLVLPPSNSFQRKLLYQETKKRFPNGILLEAKADGGSRKKFIHVRRVTLEEKESSGQSKAKMTQENLEKALGFTQIVEYLAASKKPVVVHNGFLDILHIHDKCVDTLPARLEDFKKSFNSVFSCLYDTKTMAVSPQLKDRIGNTSLEALSKTLHDEPFGIPDITFPKGFLKYSDSGSNMHEAGYDAFVTALCFLGLSYELTVKKPGAFDHSEITKFANHLHLQNFEGRTYVNLAGMDPQEERSHVFAVSGFAKEFRMHNFMKLFEGCGQFYVKWADDTLAFMIFRTPEHLPQVREKFVGVEREDKIVVTPYEEWLQQQPSDGSQLFAKTPSRSQGTPAAKAPSAITPSAKAPTHVPLSADGTPASVTLDTPMGDQKRRRLSAMDTSRSDEM